MFAFALSEVLKSLVYGITSTDPGTYLGVAVVFAAVALLATLGPAIRAARTDPLSTIHHE
jgi:ABC-type lipoprotein release transport system permease subunit